MIPVANATKLKNQWVAKLDSHLRKTSRQLVRFDTLEETLNYLLESFGQELTCDFVAIILKEKGYLVPKKWRGAKEGIEEQLTMPMDPASAELLTRTRWWQKELLNLEEESPFIIALLKQDLSTWFTVPLNDEGRSFGFCVIGFRQFVPIIMELEQNFIEFGKDVAVALGLAIEKEKQKQKIKGIEWLKESVFDGSSLHQLVEKIASQAGRGTNAQSVVVYLFDEEENQFVFQPPAYGEFNLPTKIYVDGSNSISNYFPILEKTGGRETVVPLVVNLKTVGVLYVRKKEGDVVTEEDLELLHFLSAHVSAMIENARLYMMQLEEKNRLRTFLEHHRKLVKQTVEGEGFEGITATVYEILEKPVVLTDQFFRVISYAGMDKRNTKKMLALVRQHEGQLVKKKTEMWFSLPLEPDHHQQLFCGVWPVVGGGDLLGFFLTQSEEPRLRSNKRIILDYALNIYALQFIKHKIMTDTYDHLKNNFIGHFLEAKQVDQHTLLEYSRLLNWDVMEEHAVAVIYIELGKEDVEGADVLDVAAQKSLIWDKVKGFLAINYPELLFARKNQHFVLIAPVKDVDQQSTFWKEIYSNLKQAIIKENPQANVFLGIGEGTKSLLDYAKSFKQAIQTVQVVKRRYRQQGYAFFSQLGAYTILYQQNSPAHQLFVDRYLGPLLNHEGHKGVDLVHTLRVYLENNGNLKKTAEQLFIHRSTLQYRLERIADILKIDLQDAEETFNLMLALKLYDLRQIQ